MIPSSKILWGEGLFLRPQHFQRQDAYHEARLARAMRLLDPNAWGVARLAVDEEALAAGVLRVDELLAVMPDGETVDAPREDLLPEPVAVAAGDDALRSYHLVLPPMRADACNQSGEGQAAAARYAPHTQTAADWFSGAVEAELVLLRRRPRLLPAEDAAAAAGLPLLRVQRAGNGRLQLDPGFVPPALSLDAVPALRSLLRRTLDRLQAKVAALHGLQREPSRHVVEFRSGDVASFWLLHTASAAYARLAQLQPVAAHPARLFGELSALAGALMTFSRERTLADLPAYRHEAPERGFAAVDALLRELLETVISTRCVSVVLEEARPSFHTGRLSAERIAADAALYLGVESALPRAELVEAVPGWLKLGAPDDVERLVHSAVSGVRLVHAAQVPGQIPVRPGASYFALEPRGPLYERMLQAQTVAVYAPAGLPELRLELHAVNRR